MNKKLFYILLSGLVVLILVGCGTSIPKLEDKTEKADYAKMQNKQFNAKYTYLKNVTCNGDVKSDLYQNNKVMEVYEKGDNENLWYTIVVTDCDKNSEIKSKMGTQLNRDEININKAEVVPESLGNEKLHPTLLVKQSDIEMIQETKLEEMLKSDKPYREIDGIFTMMMSVKDGRLSYDKEKYSQRVENLLKEYENESAGLHQKIEEEEKVRENTPQVVTSKYKAKFGKILEANQLGKSLTIKFKIEPSSSNKLTINQNGFNVEDLITNQGGDEFDTISYWAIADMTDGTESKVISYTLNKDLIQKIKNKQVFGQQIASMADDVWILSSLKN